MSKPPFLVYIADDDEDDLLFIQSAFRELGLENVCKGFLSGEDLLEYLKFTLANKIPDIVVLDYDMPRMNGREILLRLRQMDHLENVPVIFYSDKISNGLESELKEMGAYCCIKKGMNRNDQMEFARSISEFLKK